MPLPVQDAFFELIEEKPQVPDADDAVTLKNASGNVVF